VLDAYIIDWLQRQEEKKRQERHEQPQIPLPIPDDYIPKKPSPEDTPSNIYEIPIYPDHDKDEKKVGVVIFELSRSYRY
jgi:hypothetical protein